MLTELSLQHFKAHEDTRFSLERLTVLVGPNASGKTSALDAIRSLSAVSRDPVSVLLAEEDLGWIVQQGASEPMVLRCEGVTGSARWAGSLTVPSSSELSQARDEWQPAQAGFGASFLRLESRRLGEPSYSDKEVPRLDEDGYGLATVLSTLKLTSTDRFDALQDAPCRIISRMRRLGFRRKALLESRPRTLTVEGQKVLVQDKVTVIVDELLLDFDDASGLPARVASEGTLVVLGILAALHAEPPPSLLLVDDLDRALHPKAQRDLVRALSAALDAKPDAQIVATTHSPYLVDELAPEQVVVLGRSPGGPISAKRLSDHPKAGLLDVLTTGKFWAAEGEEWIAAQRADASSSWPNPA
jgi:AAA domain, putative AbiEii toxin, Type IV TA system/AAA ATPase domain